MKFLLAIVYWALPAITFSQVKDTIYNKAGQDSVTTIPRPEILSGGFIDIMQNGQMNASARLFKLYIGDPSKFQLPLSIYSGVSANNFHTGQSSDDIVLALISPGTGFFNMSFDGTSRIVGNKKNITSLHIQYQTGFRFLSVFNPVAYQNTVFSNLISGLGITFITGAWERNKPANIGAFWINFRGLYSNSAASVFSEFFTMPVKNNVLGCSGGLGLEISQTLNVKIFSFHFLNNQELPAFSQAILQLSFNYSMR
jgi:hypothetical protein